MSGSLVITMNSIMLMQYENANAVDMLRDVASCVERRPAVLAPLCMRPAAAPRPGVAVLAPAKMPGRMPGAR